MDLWVRLALHHWRADGHFPYWVDEMWAGTPAPALVSMFAILSVVPLAAVFGTEEAVKLWSLAAQVVGAVGAVVLARSLWGGRVGPVVAGLVFGLHPMLVTQLGLWGSEPVGWVIAMLPWFAWSLRKALRGDGPRYVGVAALTGGLALVEQAEYAYALALLGSLYLLLALCRARALRRPTARPVAVLVRAVAVVVLVGAATAHWLLPLLSQQHDFVLTPPQQVEAFLSTGSAGDIGRHPATFLTRASGTLPASPVDSSLDLRRAGSYYLGWVALAMTALAAALAPRRDREGYFTATLLAGAVGLLLSTAAVPLARSDPAVHGQVLPFLVAGLLLGVVVGGFARRLGLGRAPVAVASVLGGLAFAAIPYLTPFLTLQAVVPFLATMRLPRFFTLAILALSLGVAFPITVAERWAQDRDRRLAPWLATALAIAVVGAVAVDVRPYRSLYRLSPPAVTTSGYPRAARWLTQREGSFRVGVSSWGDPRGTDALVSSGLQLATGWPHPLAARDLFRLTAAPWIGVAGSDTLLRGLGLASGRYIVSEAPLSPPGDKQVVFGDVQVNSNPRALPMVRTYDHAVGLGSGDIAPELALDLAFRGVGVVADDTLRRTPLAADARAAVASSRPCAGATVASAGTWTGGLEGDIAQACAVHRWLGLFPSNQPPAGAEQTVGAVFTSPADGLAGVAVQLDREPRRTRLVLRQVGPDGRTLGTDLVSVPSSGPDADGRWRFEFPPLAASAGRRFAFFLACPSCARKDGSRLQSVPAAGGTGDVLVGDQLDTANAAIFYPIYRHMADVPNATPDIAFRRPGPGRWDVRLTSNTAQLLVVSESWFPGWQATVDGRPAKVLKADGAFLGVVLRPGAHTVALRYTKPAAAWVGRVVTALGLAAAAFFVAFRRRRRRMRAAARLPVPGTPPAGTAAGAVTGARAPARRRPEPPPEVSPSRQEDGGGRVPVGPGGDEPAAPVPGADGEVPAAPPGASPPAGGPGRSWGRGRRRGAPAVGPQGDGARPEGAGPGGPAPARSPGRPPGRPPRPHPGAGPRRGRREGGERPDPSPRARSRPQAPHQG
jgi:hypothetical protein